MKHLTQVDRTNKEDSLVSAVCSFYGNEAAGQVTLGGTNRAVPMDRNGLTDRTPNAGNAVHPMLTDSIPGTAAIREGSMK